MTTTKTRALIQIITLVFLISFAQATVNEHGYTIATNTTYNAPSGFLVYMEDYVTIQNITLAMDYDANPLDLRVAFFNLNIGSIEPTQVISDACKDNLCNFTGSNPLLSLNFTLNPGYYWMALYKQEGGQYGCNGIGLNTYPTLNGTVSMPKASTDFTWERGVKFNCVTGLWENSTSIGYSILKVGARKNTLPSYNISHQEKDCIKVNETYIDHRFNFSSYDIDNDTVYWSWQNYDDKNTLKSVLFNKKEWVVIKPDFTFLLRVENRSNCNISNTDWVNSFEKNYLAYDVGLSKYLLYLQSNCSGDKAYTYALPNPLKSQFYSTTIYELEDNESFNLTFYSPAFQDVVSKLLISKENGRVLVRLANGTILINTTTVNQHGQVDISVHQFTNDTNYVTISDAVNGVGFYDLTSINRTIAFIDLSYTGDIYQEDFYYSGSEILRNWTNQTYFTTKIKTKGEYCYDFLITDSFHLGWTQEEEQVCFKVTDCKFMPEGTISEGNPLGTFRRIISNSVVAFLEATDTYETGKTVLWFAWLIMFIGLFITEWFMLRRLEITFPLIASSFLCFVIAWVCLYTFHIITFLILLAFGLAFPLAGYFTRR